MVINIYPFPQHLASSHLAEIALSHVCQQNLDIRHLANQLAKSDRLAQGMAQYLLFFGLVYCLFGCCWVFLRKLIVFIAPTSWLKIQD